MADKIYHTKHYFIEIFCLLQMIKVLVQVMHDIITDHILAWFNQYITNPITNLIIKKWNVKIFTKICQLDDTKL